MNVKAAIKEKKDVYLLTAQDKNNLCYENISLTGNQVR